MSGIFISYRRGDRPGFAGRLAEALENVFGPEHVFRDIEDIRPGEDFVEVIAQRIAASDLVLVVIGPDWLDASHNGRRRLDEPDDLVRQEIDSALRASKPVWPVLVSGATMPVEHELPTSIRALARRQAVILTEAGWRDDVARLIAALSPLMLVARRRKRARGGRRAIVAAFAAFLVVALATAWVISDAPSRSLPVTESRPVSSGPMTDAQTGPGQPAGSWSARVRYEWGAEHDESLELHDDAGEIRGTISFLGIPRIIEAGEWRSDGSLHLTTRSESMAGGETRTLTHRYHARIAADRLDFILETTGGASPERPIRFSARRITASN